MEHSPRGRVRIFVATTPVDFRKGHDGLAAMVQTVLRKDPFTGTVFLFRAKRMDRLKLLYWDGTGLAMAYKRLEDTTFTWSHCPAGDLQSKSAERGRSKME
ncbi:MAG: IS66 family insertion sequence element accessory protein TnpB [Rhodobacterales bacterium]